MSAPQQLHDIVTAPAVSWWPPAKGWWLLAALGILLIAGVSVWCYRYWRLRRAQRAALKQLTQLAQQAEPATWAQLNLLLKQAALAYFDRAQIAALTGLQWQQFLLQQLPTAAQAQWHEALARWQQQALAGTSHTAEPAGFEFAKVWLKRGLPPTKLKGQQ